MNTGFDGFPFADDECHPLTIASCHHFGDAEIPVVSMNPLGSFVLPPTRGATTYGLLSGSRCGYTVCGDRVCLFNSDSFVELPLFSTDVVAITGCSAGSLISVAIGYGRTVTVYRIEDSSMATEGSTHTLPSAVIDLHWTGGIDGHVVGLTESGPFTLNGTGVVAASRGAVFRSETVTYWDAENGYAAFTSGSDIEVWGCNTSWCRLSSHRCSFPIHYLSLHNGVGVAYSRDGCLRSFSLDSSQREASVQSTISSSPNASCSGHVGLMVFASGGTVSVLSASYPYESGNAAPMAVTSKFLLPCEAIALHVEGQKVMILSQDGIVYEVFRRPTSETLQDVVSRSDRQIVADRWQTPAVLADATWIGLQNCQNKETCERLCDVGEGLMEPTMQFGRITLAPMVRRAMFHSGPTILQGERRSIEAHHAALLDFFVNRGWAEITAAEGLQQSDYYLSFPEIILAERSDLPRPVQLGLQAMVLRLLVQGLENLIRYVRLVEDASPLMGGHLRKHHPQTVCWGQPSIYHDVVNSVLGTVGGASLLLMSDGLDSVTLAKAKVCNLIDANNVQAALKTVGAYSLALHEDGGGGLKLIIRMLQAAAPHEPMEVYVLCLLLDTLPEAASNAYWLRVESILDGTEGADWYLVAKALVVSLKGRTFLLCFTKWISRQSVLDARLLYFSSCYEQLTSMGVTHTPETPLLKVANALNYRPHALLDLARTGSFSLLERKKLVDLAESCDEGRALRRHLVLQEELMYEVADSEHRKILELNMCNAATLAEVSSSVRRHDIQIEVLCADSMTDEGALEDALRLFLSGNGSIDVLLNRIHDHVGSIALILLRVVALSVPPEKLLGLISSHTSPLEAIDAVIVGVEHALQHDSLMEEWPVAYLSACEGLLNTLEISDDSQYRAMRLGDTIRRLLSLARLGHLDIKDEDITRLSEMGSRIDIP